MKKTIKKLLCTILVAAMVLPCIPTGISVLAAEKSGQEEFVPVLRFSVASDVHIRNNTAALNGHEQLALLYKTAYAYSEADPNYNKLDGMFFIGDNTQTGSEQQQTYFFNYLKENTKEGTYALATMGNHEFKATGQNYSDPEGATAKFLEYSGYETTDTRFELNGYQFIAFAPDLYNKTNGIFFTEAKLAWLKQELDAAVAATPDKPIFVMQHQPPYQTMKGSQSKSSADEGLKNLLVNYPQVIDFSGHTHCSLTDPRIIWQGEFTAINTGGMAYLSIPIMNGKNNQSGGRSIDAEGGWIAESEDSAIRNAGMYYIVEVDKDHRVRVLTYNTFTQSLWGEPYIIDSLDPKDFRYTNDRANDAVKPAFAADAQLKLVTNNYKNLQFTIPQATCQDVVQSYRVEVYQGSTLRQTFYRSSNAHYGEAAPAVNAYVKNLQPDTKYTIKVYATSSYNIDSQPIVMQVTTSAETAVPKADVLDVLFRADGTAVNQVNGEVLTTYGQPTVDYTYALQSNVASFDGVDDAYGFWGISNWYDVLGESFTLETYAYLEQKPGSENMGVLCNLQSAGMGFSYHKDGTMHFYTRNSSSAYTYPGVPMEPGSWVHMTGTYDGKTVKFYVDGVLVAEEAATGKLVVPDFMARCMCIGADSAVDDRQGYFAGKIATARIYTDVLTAEQVAQAYGSISTTDKTPVCPEHETDTWTEVTPEAWAAGGELKSGHYVLTGDVALSAALTVATGEQVCINLAGYDITASAKAGADTWYRVFENNGTLTIVDSNLYSGVISGGVAWVSDAEAVYAKGGNIYNGENAVFNLYGGTISGGVATTAAGYKPGSMGGNIFGAAGSVINIYGGTVTGGTATKGGSYTSDCSIIGGNIGSYGTVNISGGIVTGGKSTQSYTSGTSSRYLHLYGGNIGIQGGGTLNISGGAVTDGASIGTRTNNSSTAKLYGRGGNIYVSGDVNISGGRISGGKIQLTAIGTATGTTSPATAQAYGANLYMVNGKLNMTGGTISGGVIDSIAKASEASTSTGKAETQGYGGNLYLTEGVTATVTGGTITAGQVVHNAETGTSDVYGGNIALNNAAVITISGGTVSAGYSYYRGGNISLKGASVVTLTGNAVVTGGQVSTAKSSCDGDNLFVTGADTVLNIAENAQIVEGYKNSCIYTVTNPRINMYGGTVRGNISLAATATYNKGSLMMYGGSLDSITKTSYIPVENVRIYNGVMRSANAVQYIAPCACYSERNGVYTVWHKNETDGNCAVCAYNYKDIALQTGKHTYTATETAGTATCHCGDVKTGVVAVIGQNAYTTLTDALATGASLVTLVGNAGAEAVQVSKNAVLDLNGFDVAADLTVTEGVSFQIKDSQTEDYTVADGKYGKLTGKLTGAETCEGFLALTEATGVSYHKVDAKITHVSLRAGCAGLYYTAAFQYDEAVAAQVATTGVTLSTENRLPVADGSDATSLYTTAGTSVLVSGIMKEENEPEVNKANARQWVWGRAYLKLTDGSYVYSETAEASLQAVVQAVNSKLWDSLTDAQKASLTQLYTTYQEEMKNWEIDNLK